MDFRILQGGLGLRAAQDYDEQQAQRTYAQRAREYGVRRMAAGDSLLDAQVGEKRAALADQGRARENQEAYRQLGGGGASLDVLAGEAQKRGDFGAAKEFRTTKTNIEREGLKNVIIAGLGGADDRKLEEIYNASGQDRVDVGSVKLDRQTGVASYTRNGEPGQLNLVKMGDLLGMTKPREPKQTVVPAGSQLAVDGKIVATNTAGVEAKSVADRSKLDYEYKLRRGLEQFKASHGARATTALQQNIDFMVKNKIAADPTEAFTQLRTAMEKPEEDAILTVAGNLMRGGRYFGKDGWKKAVNDATTMVRTVKGGKPDQPAPAAGDPAPALGQPAPGAGMPAAAAGGRSYTVQGKTFTDADIDATARQYGITSDQVRQRLGIR